MGTSSKTTAPQVPGSEPPPPSMKRPRDEGWDVANDLLKALAERTLRGDMGARAELMVLLMPWIKVCVHKTLTRHVIGGLRACSEEEIKDYVHDVLVHVMERDHAVLRGWNPERPLSPYLATVTQNLVLSSLRTKSKNPRTNQRLPDDPGAYEARDDGLELRIEAEDYERAVYARLEKQLRGRGLSVLQLTTEGHTIEEIARMAGMSRAAVNTHHSRIRKAAAAVRAFLEGRGSREKQ